MTAQTEDATVRDEPEGAEHAREECCREHGAGEEEPCCGHHGGRGERCCGGHGGER